jgi:hypothetical protein
VQVDRTALWILMVACCVPSLAWTWRRALRRAGPGALVEATMVGLGIGLSAATVVLLAAALVVRLEG